MNELIDVFNDDGINDRQLIHKRTIDFINDRYLFLSIELDSIEINKQIFKKNNELVDIKINSSLSLEKSSKSEENIFVVENQMSLTTMLEKSINDNQIDLLPSNIGVDNEEINSLILEHNKIVLSRNKLLMSAGKEHPSVKEIEMRILSERKNILFSLKNYVNYLQTLRNKYLQRLSNYENQVSNFPEKEKILRSIERNQQIKEALYLFLLQKREESEISYAVTEPSIKIVERAITNDIPFKPRALTVYALAIILGLLSPFLFLYVFFMFDTKIHSKEDIEISSSDLDLIAEIPFFDFDETKKVFSDPNDRSIISESFRMLMSNSRYLENSETKNNVFIVTSSIKGEGKTLNALNLSLSFSSLERKVLLIGCDLRNPQLHKYIGVDKNIHGLVDYLVDANFDWKKHTIRSFQNNPNHEILLSGALPPNPLNLINNGNLDLLIEEARNIYDYIIIDSAPTLLVADTNSMFNLADAIIYIARCNLTDKDIIKHISSISKETNANIGLVLNGVGQKNAYGYSYGYKYSYGYNYKYSYNYGYGYGYSEDEEKT